ncbi:glutamine--tRNA ligase/YqeY domain fusion protein [Propionibacterium australiense]|uniref:Glutamine--tRNA ligase n=1 Tax=Propionibacterium australiense TaxID=119981 RepID=A0A383S2E0_9ACTN|nr:glutamine--tRNA ligase/YqeY domain fusion protein [Propionibacterium australiense]RLP11463.1 glutamine--tRNA ligase/YqeY domain fusion protein [Propionibacterium australiense]SYZ32160.1 Glutamine-tRNA ligase [Propionibacterium australiense]VEH90778.1 Glutamine--tRNA ligase [Propionibacterium australiense]
MANAEGTGGAGDFISDAIERDNEDGVYTGRVQTRFPPEPNGYLHIGHAKAITVDFGAAEKFGGVCNVRLDDTNPVAEDPEFVQSILDDIAWLGYEPAAVLHASGYFEQLYQWARHLIQQGLAYVDDQDNETISAQRGGYGRPGVESPYRDRSVEENLDLFTRMRAGEFPDGSRVLRAKIDMATDNMVLRDPVMYRIRHAEHHQTGMQWPIYPTYDWAHGQSDAIEGVTHSLCTLEFDTHRPLYDWYLNHLPLPAEKPRQIEFARLELTYTITSKRRLATLVRDGVVDGWDDPRMPTLRGLRRRGYPAKAVRDFCTYLGTTRTNARHNIEELESFVRRELNATSQRRMVVTRPLHLVIDNWPTDENGAPVVEYFPLTNNPENPDEGTRQVAFTGDLFIEREDFAETPPPKFFRLSPGREVRLRGAYFVTATDVVRDEAGEIVEVHASYDPATRGGDAPDGRKVKSTMHWVSVPHAVDVDVALYDRLFTTPNPGEETGEPLDDLNPGSRELLAGAKGEAAISDVEPGQVVQFERLGYFAADLDRPGLFHRTVGLRDEWAALQRKASKAAMTAKRA